MRNAWVTLGRAGDLINSLPLVLHDYQNGNHPTVVVSRPFADLLEGVGYCDVIEWHGHYSKPMEAKKYVESLGGFDDILVPQPYGQVWPKDAHLCKTGNFCAEAYHLVGSLNLFGNLPLVFDRRDHEREKQWIPKTDKPIVVVCWNCHSQPFSPRSELTKALSPLAETHEIVDISEVRAHRMYDLLGLLEAASYLVTVNTGILHLARAVPNLPVIVLTGGAVGGSFDAAPSYQQHVARIHYDEFPKRVPEMLGIIRNKVIPIRKFIHVWSKYHISNMSAAKRHRMAKLTWDKEMKGWIDMPLTNDDFERHSGTDLDDNKSVPYIPDILNRGAQGAGPADVIVLTNDDTCVAPDLTKELTEAMAGAPAIWCARREHRRIDHPMSKSEVMHGRKHVGADLFAVTKDWWMQHGHKMPDMLLAYENWDYVLRTVIEDNGGMEVEGLCYHEVHQGDWTFKRNLPASKHNQNVGGMFFELRKNQAA